LAAITDSASGIVVMPEVMLRRGRRRPR
jgi:hypothetical protein